MISLEFEIKHGEIHGCLVDEENIDDIIADYGVSKVNEVIQEQIEELQEDLKELYELQQIVQNKIRTIIL